MTKHQRLRLLRENHGLPIRDMAMLLRFRTAWHFQDWHERTTGDTYAPRQFEAKGEVK